MNEGLIREYRGGKQRRSIIKIKQCYVWSMDPGSNIQSKLTFTKSHKIHVKPLAHI